MVGLRAVLLLAVIGFAAALTPDQVQQHLEDSEFESSLLYDLQVPEDDWESGDNQIADLSEFLKNIDEKAVGTHRAGVQPYFDEFLEEASSVDDLDWAALEKDLSSDDFDSPKGTAKLNKVLDAIKPMSLDEEDDVTATVDKAEAEAEKAKKSVKHHKSSASKLAALAAASETEMIEAKKESLEEEESEARKAEARARAAEAEAKAAEAKAKLEAEKATQDEKSAESEEGSAEKKSETGPRVIHHFSPPPDVPPPPSANYDKWSPPGTSIVDSPAKHKSDLSGPVNPPPLPSYNGAAGTGGVGGLLPPQLGSQPNDSGVPPKATVGYSLEAPAPGVRDFPEFSPTVSSGLASLSAGATSGIADLGELPTPQSVEMAAGGTPNLAMPALPRMNEEMAAPEGLQQYVAQEYPQQQLRGL